MPTLTPKRHCGSDSGCCRRMTRGGHACRGGGGESGGTGALSCDGDGVVSGELRGVRESKAKLP